MTKQQQVGFESWKQDQTQPLPKSLKNVFIEDCLKKIESNKKAKKRFDAVSDLRDNYIGGYSFCNNERIPLRQWEKTLIILTLLSRTPKGKAVMPFLDVETKKYKNFKNELQKSKNLSLRYEQSGYEILKERCEGLQALYITELEYTPQTLDHLLYNKFTEALRLGKTFDQALEIVTKTYLLNL